MTKVCSSAPDGTSVFLTKFNFKFHNILSVSQFDKKFLEQLFHSADEMKKIVEEFGTCNLLAGKILTCLFYEPSTRTSASFFAAMKRLGGDVIPITEGVKFSSVSKGETLADTIRTLEQYSDIIVLRHPDIGSASIAADYANIPVINAGDGAGEHPTQALLDMYTIKNGCGKIDGLKIAMVGDLKYGRTVHSLTKLLANYDVSLRFISPDSLRMPLEITNPIVDSGLKIREYNDIGAAIKNADVLYVTRIQKERFADMVQYEEISDLYNITPELMSKAKNDMIVMHPLPRVGEIHYSVDKDPRAIYFDQAKNGMFIRMVLLGAVLGKL